jgi:hypothetical protein
VGLTLAFALQLRKKHGETSVRVYSKMKLEVRLFENSVLRRIFGFKTKCQEDEGKC